MDVKIKKLISIILIVAVVFGNNGVSILARSVNSVILNVEQKEKPIPNYYYLYGEDEFVEETTIEQYEEYQEYQEYQNLVQYSNTDLILNPNGFIVDVLGNIKDAEGNTVGIIYIGDVVNVGGRSFTDNKGITYYSDGTISDKYGNFYYPDGSILMSNGFIYYLNGNVRDNNGVLYCVDGSIVYEDGSMKDTNGFTYFVDGSYMLPEGIRYYIDGRIEYADGTVIFADGTVIKPEISIIQQIDEDNVEYTLGNWEYDPNNNNWRFVNIDKQGAKVVYKDKWISAKNSNGKAAWYMVDGIGNMVTGWVKVDGEFYYMSKKSEDKGEMQKGDIFVEGRSYKLDPESGKLLSDVEPTNDYVVIGAVNHKSGVDGNWQYDKETGIKSFKVDFKMNDGTVLQIPPSGWYMVDGHYYYFDEQGVPMTGLIISDDKYYYMNNDGTMLEGGTIEIDGITYEFDKATGACRSFS